MPNYQLTKIYKLILKNDENPIYIGHTTNKHLSSRLSVHRNHYKLWKDGKFNKLSYFCLDLDVNNINIELIENHPCENVQEARKRESYWINFYNLKQKQPITIKCIGETYTAKEYMKEYFKETKYHLSYYQKNKERIREYQNKRYKSNGNPRGRPKKSNPNE